MHLACTSVGTPISPRGVRLAGRITSMMVMPAQAENPPSHIPPSVIGRWWSPSVASTPSHYCAILQGNVRRCARELSTNRTKSTRTKSSILLDGSPENHLFMTRERPDQVSTKSFVPRLSRRRKITSLRFNSVDTVGINAWITLKCSRGFLSNRRTRKSHEILSVSEWCRG